MLNNYPFLFSLLLLLQLMGCSTMSAHSEAERNFQSAIETLPVAPLAVTANIERQPEEILLSPGDRLRIIVDDGAPFSGIFQVDIDGKLHIPFLTALSAVGLSISQLQENLAEALVKEKLFQPGYARASINILQWAPIQISVSGAVFQPGRILLNELQGTRAKDSQLLIAQESGDYPVQRFLSYALKGAAGVKPIADLRHVSLVRAGVSRDFDLTGVFTGRPVIDVPLIAGDEIIVPALDRVQPEYIRPSQITPPGFELRVSAHSSTVSRQERSVSYGSQLSMGLVAGECVGGSEMIDGDRDAILISRNIFTGQLENRKYAIQDVLTHINDPVINPYLMPGDAIACFNSTLVNVRETMKTIGDMMSPFVMLMLLL